MVQGHRASNRWGGDSALLVPGTLSLTIASVGHGICAPFRAVVDSGSKGVYVVMWWHSVAFGGQPQEGCGRPHEHPLWLGHLGCTQLPGSDTPTQAAHRQKTCDRALPLTVLRLGSVSGHGR